MGPDETPNTVSTQPNVTVWFDSQCPLCVREIALMRRMDRAQRIRFIDAYEAESCPIDRDTLLARFHARDEDGKLVSGAAAFAAMWRVIPILRPLGQAARWQPMLKVLEWGYLRFLGVRPALQRVAHRLTSS